MKRQGIRGASRAKKRFTTHADKNNLRAPDLVQRSFVASRPDRLWVADFTYCSTWSGVVYVAFIIDVFSRRLVGWKASRTMTASLVVDALNMAAWTRHTKLDGLICHTDAGANTRVFATPTASTSSASPPRSAPSVIRLITPWPNRSWASSRPSCIAILQSWPTTVVTGKDSTTSRSPRARGCRGSTKNDFTASSTTARHSKLRKSILSQIKPRWREISKFGSLQETQADSESAEVNAEVGDKNMCKSPIICSTLKKARRFATTQCWRTFVGPTGAIVQCSPRRSQMYRSDPAASRYSLTRYSRRKQGKVLTSGQELLRTQNPFFLCLKLFLRQDALLFI